MKLNFGLVWCCSIDLSVTAVSTSSGSENCKLPDGGFEGFRDRKGIYIQNYIFTNI